MNPSTTEALITFILGGGLIALITQIIRASRLWKSGRLATTREVIRDMAAARDQAEDREEEQRTDNLYWTGVAAGYRFQLLQAGITPHPENPESPSAVRRRKEAARERLLRRDRAQRASLAPTTEEIHLALGEDDSDPRLR